MTTSTVLCINSGSSSLKFSIIRIEDGGREQTLVRGAVERIGDAEPKAWLQRGEQPKQESAANAKDHGAALEQAFSLIGKEQVDAVDIGSHRLVHGGPRHVEPELVDDALLASLQEVVALAPLHLPPGLAGIASLRKQLPELPQVACFDTAFHAALPDVARRFALPERFADPSLRRYGFHGLSYEYILSVLGPARPSKIVIAHLGSGASLVAVADGRSIDTTMGLTPTGGVIMGTRTGDLDPGVLVYLQRKHGLSPEALEQVVDRESGLLALGGTSDMTKLVERAHSDADPAARLAVSMFAYSVKKAIGALTAALGGIDLLVFTGGIGEHASTVRREICDGLEALGIGGGAQGCEIRVIPTDEDLVLARHAHRLRTAR